MTVSQNTFDGLAFPVARVRFNGPTDRRGARYSATLRRDTTFRASVPYDHGIGGGARGALPAAVAALERALAAIDSRTTAADYIAIPGDLDSDSYVFTFVPRELLDR